MAALGFKGELVGEVFVHRAWRWRVWKRRALRLWWLFGQPLRCAQLGIARSLTQRILLYCCLDKFVCVGRPEEHGKSRILLILMIMEQLCMVIFGMMIEKFVRHGWTPLAVVAADGRSQPRVDEAIQAMRSVMTQTPVRYTWYASQPRFVPLGEREHGAWLW